MTTQKNAALIEVSEREPRARALLGDRPLVTLVDRNDPDTCLSVKLVRAGRGFVGVVDDRAALIDRIRMGLVPGFVMHHDAQTATLTGELEVRIVDQHPSAAQLLEAQPFASGRSVVIEVVPRGLAIVEEGPAKGAVPRT